MRARVPPFVLVLIGLALTVGLGNAWLGGRGSSSAPWWAYLFLILLAVATLALAGLLRLISPLFSALVQASTSREREFLADATSVEFTRNAHGLELALTSLAGDTDTLAAANRGTQHLWFRNPVREGSDRRAGLLSTHPSLAARIGRLRTLQGLAPLDPATTAAPASET